MLRIKDPKPSLHFYQSILGMSLIGSMPNPAGKFTLYFLDYTDQSYASFKEAMPHIFGKSGILELTHNWGTEDDPTFSYHNGNSEPRGFGHLAILVDDLGKACERFGQLGVRFVKRPDEGTMKNIAFIADPDGYWVEVLAFGMK
jgi:lactoylglutathione lyase